MTYKICHAILVEIIIISEKETGTFATVEDCELYYHITMYNRLPVMDLIISEHKI